MEGASRVEDGPGIPRVCVFCWGVVFVCDRETERREGGEREGASEGGGESWGRKVDIENQDLLGAGLPGYTRMGGSF